MYSWPRAANPTMTRRAPSDPRPRWPPRRSAWPITLTYILVSVVWIALSDVAMFGLGTAGRPVLNLSLLKGLFWVTASGLLLHVIVFKQLERVRSDEAAARSRLVEAEEIGGFGASEVCAGSPPEWSDGMFRLWGRSRAEGVPDAAWLEERIDSRDVERARRAATAAMQGKDSPPYDLLIRGGDGVERVLRITSRSEVDGGRVRSLILAQDVTEEHESRRALAEAEERFRATFDQAAVGIAHLSPDGVVVRVNRTICSGLGYARDELVGLPAASLVHPDDLVDALDRFARIDAETSSFETWEMRCLPRDGTPVWIEATLSRARVADGGSYLIAVAQDVTRRKAMEAERQALDRKVRLLLESTRAGLFTLDLEGRCTLINRAGCESLGYSEADVLGRPMGDLIYGVSALPRDARDAVVRANEGRSTKLYNHGFLKIDGSTLPVDITVSPVFENGVVIGRAVSFVDVSDRMRLEEQLEEARRIAGLGRVAASIAHEINNVLMGIVPFAEIVSRSDEPLFRSAAEQIKQSVQRGRGVTQEILRFAREEKPARAIFAGLPWLESLAAEVQAIIGGRGRFTMRLPERAFHLEADGSQLSQVLMNLVGNARDAIDPDDGTIELTAEIADAGTRFPFGALPPLGRGWVWIRVTDNGTGIGSETLAHLFEPFFTTKHGGTGLGLAIAYRIVAAHEGLLFVESAVGKGTTFHVLLPESAPPAPVAAVDTWERKLSGEVLLVEDDETVAAGLGFILEDAGMRVRNAGSGREALAELERARPDLMILDVGLPDMHGGEVCEQALAQWPGLPVIFSTGHGDAGRLGAFLEKPHVRFLMKPYTFEQLRDAMEGVIDGADGG